MVTPNNQTPIQQTIRKPRSARSGRTHQSDSRGHSPRRDRKTVMKIPVHAINERRKKVAVLIEHSWKQFLTTER